MIPIGVMNNLNVERNLLEHEYSVPSKDRVREAVDVTRLLMLAMEKLVEATPQEAVVGWKKPVRHFLMQLEPQRGELRFFRITASGRYRKMHGMTVVSSPIRNLGGGAFVPGITVGSAPVKTIVLDRQNEHEWLPIIKELINVQRREATRLTIVDGQHGTMTIPITVPLVLPDGVSWSELLDNALRDKTEKEEATSDATVR